MSRNCSSLYGTMPDPFVLHRKARQLGLHKHFIHGTALRGITDSMVAEMYEALIGKRQYPIGA